MPSQTIRIGLECNEGCLYCFADPEMWKDRPRGWGKDYSNLIGDNWRKELREIREAGYDGLSISGGEPTLYPDLLKMVKYSRLLGFDRVELQTNATLITESNARKLSRAGVCSALVSLPSHIEKVYNAITVTKDYHDPAIAGLKNLLNAGVRVTLCHVLCTANYRYVADYVDYVAEHFPGLEAISFLYVQPEGRATANANLYPSLEDLRPYWLEAMERTDKYGIRWKTDVQTGLPLCMLPQHEDRVDAELLLNPEIFWGDDLSSYVYMQGRKRQGSKCTDCFFSNGCYGFWNEYIDAYGDEGLVPVTSTPELERLFPLIAGGASVPDLSPGEYITESRMKMTGGIRRKKVSGKKACSA
jgi:MoaA/NifB/PqqE/SkfB family radical SAM enzyme